MNYFFLFTLFFFFSCTTFSEKRNIIEIEIEKANSDDSWIVTYKLPRDVYSLVFERQNENFRKKHWRVLTNGLEISTVQDMSVIKSISGQKFNEVQVKHQSYFGTFEKDYDFFIKYSGADRLIYLGHYVVLPVVNEKDIISYKSDIWENKFLTKYSFKLREDDHIILNGEKRTGTRITWLDLHKKGTYIFWGEQNISESPELIILTDKSTPQWIAKDINKYMPQVYRFLEKKFDLALGYKPVIYINYSKPSNKYLSSTGGALPGLIQLTFNGAPWKNKNPENLEWLLWVLAHESAHLWNGQMLRYGSSRHAWMHEGSSDAIASRVLREFKVINEKTFNNYLRKAKKKCLKGLEEGFPLVESAEKRKYENYYQCGHLIAHLTELSMKDGDLFDFYKSLFKQEIGQDKIYTDAEYFNLWSRLKVERFNLKEIKKIIYKDSKNIESVFSDQRLELN